MISGGGALYRLHLVNDRRYEDLGTENETPWLSYEEATRVGGGSSSFQKRTAHVDNIIDLASGRTGVAGDGAPTITLYPNPSTDVLHVMFNGLLMNAQRSQTREKVLDAMVQVHVFDASGQLVGSVVCPALGVSDLDVSTLTTGIYTLRAQCEMSTVARTFAVVR